MHEILRKSYNTKCKDKIVHLYIWYFFRGKTIERRKKKKKVIFMADGVVQEQGTPVDIFEHPRNERLQAFLKSILK